MNMSMRIITVAPASRRLSCGRLARTMTNILTVV